MNTVERAVDLLFHLHGAAQPQGVTAVSRALGLPKSTTHRLLATLAGRGMVERDARGHYKPGVALLSLGLGVLDREPLVALARPELEAGAEALGETFFVVSARAGRLVVLDKAEGTGFLRAAPRIGQTLPVHATAVGKLYLAFAAEVLQPLDDATPLEAFTALTLTSAAELAAEVELVRTRGFAQNSDEWIDGLGVIAAPVWRGERLAGAIAIATTTARVEAFGHDALAKRVIETAAAISSRIDRAGVDRAHDGASKQGTRR